MIRQPHPHKNETIEPHNAFRAQRATQAHQSCSMSSKPCSKQHPGAVNKQHLVAGPCLRLLFFVRKTNLVPSWATNLTLHLKTAHVPANLTMSTHCDMLTRYTALALALTCNTSGVQPRHWRHWLTLCMSIGQRPFALNSFVKQRLARRRMRGALRIKCVTPPRFF